MTCRGDLRSPQGGHSARNSNAADGQKDPQLSCELTGQCLLGTVRLGTVRLGDFVQQLQGVFGLFFRHLDDRGGTGRA